MAKFDQGGGCACGLYKTCECIIDMEPTLIIPVGNIDPSEITLFFKYIQNWCSELSDLIAEVLSDHTGEKTITELDDDLIWHTSYLMAAGSTSFKLIKLTPDVATVTCIDARGDLGEFTIPIELFHKSKLQRYDIIKSLFNEYDEFLRLSKKFAIV